MDKINEYKIETIEITEPIISDYNYGRTQEPLDYNIAIKNKPAIVTSASSLLLMGA